MDKILEFIQNKMPLGAMVFDQNGRVIYYNRAADKFLKRYSIDRELASMAERIFRERQKASAADSPDTISFSKASKGIPANLSIRYLYAEKPFPRLSVFISTKPCNTYLNVDEVIRRYKLTKKEAEILRQLARGLKNADIAGELHMQAVTVRDHLRKIYKKCGVKGKLELVRNILT